MIAFDILTNLLFNDFIVIFSEREEELKDSVVRSIFDFKFFNLLIFNVYESFNKSSLISVVFLGKQLLVLIKQAILH